MRSLCSHAVAAALMTMAEPAMAQRAPEWQTCTGDPNTDWDVQIKSCTALIQSGHEAAHDLAVAYNKRGNAYYGKMDYRRAFADYDRALALDPKNIFTYNDRGLIFMVRKDYDRAIADYSRAIELDRNYAIAYDNRGIAYKDKMDYERAIADYRKAISLDPQHADYYNDRGNV